MTAAEYAAAANRHRPADPSQLVAEMRRLQSTGLKPADIAMAFRMNLAAVLTALAAQPLPPACPLPVSVSVSPRRDFMQAGGNFSPHIA